MGPATGALQTFTVCRVQILEQRGPLSLGDLQIAGGLALWIRSIELTWRHDYGNCWTLEVRVTTRVPDRFDPAVMVEVGFARNHGLFLDEGGDLRGAMFGDDRDTWVARRVNETLRWLVEHELAESVRHNGKFLVDAHADDPR